MNAKSKSRLRGWSKGVKPRRIKQKLVAKVEAELLRRVRSNPALSRVDLARLLHLAPSTIGTYVNRLITEGFLFERQKVDRDFGRPPTLLALNPKGGRFIGVDFEAENLMATLVDFSQQPMRQIHKIIAPSESAEQIVAKIEQAIEELMGDNPSTVLGIGVGVPGSIDAKNQVALHYEYIRGWENIPLGQRLTQRFNVDVFLENNIRSMALAELWFGQGRGLDNFVCLGIRTGIAAGIIARGRLLYGDNNLAGEMGEWLCPAGPMTRHVQGLNGVESWSCHALRPLEQVASVPSILSTIRELAASPTAGMKTPDSLEEVSEAARSGDKLVVEVLMSIAQTLGWVVCQINALLNPGKVILAGPLVMLGETLLTPLCRAVNVFCAQIHQEPPEVVFSELGSFNGALGAAALALHEWKPKR